MQLHGTTDKCLTCEGKEPDVIDENEDAWEIFQNAVQFQYVGMAAAPAGIDWNPMLWLIDKSGIEYPEDCFGRLHVLGMVALGEINKQQAGKGGNANAGTG